MGQVAACSTVGRCCASTEKGEEPSAVLRTTLEPDVRLVAWIRRRSGPDCDFGEVFEEIFGSRDPVGESKFASVLKERGAESTIDAVATFQKINAGGKGAIGAAEFEAWQELIERKEAEGLRYWRDWLRMRYTTPSAAFHAMGKGEGDVLTEPEFTACLSKIGFQAKDPVELFRFIDKDFSGEVTFAEFKSAMRSVGVSKEKVKSTGSRRSSKNNSPKSSKEPSPRPHKSSKEPPADSEGSDSENVGQDARMSSKGGQIMDSISLSRSTKTTKNKRPAVSMDNEE